MLKGAIGAAWSTPPATLGVLLGNSINMHAGKIYYRMKNEHGVKLMKDDCSRELKAKEFLIMPSDKIARIYPFENKYTISFSSKRIGKTIRRVCYIVIGKFGAEMYPR